MIRAAFHGDRFSLFPDDERPSAYFDGSYLITRLEAHFSAIDRDWLGERRRRGVWFASAASHALSHNSVGAPSDRASTWATVIFAHHTVRFDFS